MLFDILTWALAGLTVAGSILNIKHDRNGFLIWIFTNATWAIIDFMKGIPQQGLLFVVYLGLSVWGYFRWTDVVKSGEETSSPTYKNYFGGKENVGY